ncbi:putative mitochondrial mitochondrial RNA binding complex 1 subunit [Leptomonas pyrrhocoris]|uniref:Putative mitochondrial mitochondrial RNA binding complex 1 subunit n=1 Tax=Leptomonas pyrrhocoris TaxID=157538 RepID=A0A0M9G7Z7_LEPPY|nr:putative mitochondrial mitochondrial RNA binding complex 1 subunit [Leptomonas pyrrhocoris]KPA84453.1 putative mitochondrial mitochondrial RNA binding complex 1 subunit [Leptomonas pyrrhocoris]|eukprot:XP_015662892.1 putative mitochondrial mitochondrial RNA binding complex 1 subunit [Leptomonas pyrrhocoris]
MQQLRHVFLAEVRGSRLCFSPLVSTSKRTCTTGFSAARWTCTCGFNNYGFHRQCFRCNKARDDLSSSKQISLAALLDDAHADTATVNDEQSITAVSTPVVPAEGVWMCAACNTFNNSTRGACVHCGEVRPSGRLSDRASGSTLIPDASIAASSHRARHPAEAPQSFKRGDWYCSCGAHNFARNTHCRDCQAPAPVQRRAALRHNASSQDWVCPACDKYNFSRRTECMRCHHSRPPSQNNEAKGSAATGAESQGWVCQACHSMNPSDSASGCVICGTPK